MIPSREYLERCSSQTGYAIGPLEKVVRLGEMAADMARHPFLGKVLAIKGGTALNLCFGPPKRLSVDLDCNYIGHVEREKMLTDRPKVEAAVFELGRRQGYQIQKSADAFAGRKLYFLYRSVLGQNERIEVDLNFLFRMPLDGTEMREFWQPGELDFPRVRIVGLQEILVGKLLALLDRCAARDVWDVANLPEQATGVLRLPSFRARFIALSAILDHPLATYTRTRLDDIVTSHAVVEHLAPMLMADMPFQLSGLVDQAWSMIMSLLSLRPHEEEYLAAIYKGELYPELLFSENPEEAKRIAGHPAILWKIANVRAHLAMTGFKGPFGSQ